MTAARGDLGSNSLRPPRGFRYAQLAEFVRLLDRSETTGVLLDIGSGTGWLANGWNGASIGLDIVPSGANVTVIASAAALPLRAGEIDVVAAVASLGAFEPGRQLDAVLAEVTRVLRPGGVFCCLVSARHRFYDRFAVHKRLDPSWTSFTKDELREGCAANGLVVCELAERGGMMVFVAEWIAFLLSRLPLARLKLSRFVRFIGELDRGSLGTRRYGRFLYLSSRKK